MTQHFSSPDCEMAYNDNISSILGKLEILKEHIAQKSESTEFINWGHVGSAEHVCKLLDEIMVFEGLMTEK